MGKFVPGHKKVGGRKAGARNRVTRVFKASVLGVYDKLGGDSWLYAWASQKKNQGEFVKVWARFIPLETNLTIEQPIESVDRFAHVRAVAFAMELARREGGYFDPSVTLPKTIEHEEATATDNADAPSLAARTAEG